MTALLNEGVQGTGEGDHPPQPGTLRAGRHRRTAPVCQRVDELLRHQPHLPHGAGTGRLDKAACKALLLETVETAPHTQAAFDQDGDQPRPGSHGQPQSQGLLAHEW